MTGETLGVCSYNIHKGFSQLNFRMAIHELREQLQGLDPDISLLQEVQGEHIRHARRHPDWPSEPQHEFLADGLLHAAYGRNAVYAHGHHGNAVLSRFPIVAESNHDVSLYRLEQRGILHCELSLPLGRRLHCLSVHLSLTEYQRRRQLGLLAGYVENNVPRDEPLIIAGDFNDWRQRAGDLLPKSLGLVDAFTALHGHPARTYPSHLPLLRLDRIYVRGFQVEEARVFWGKPWSSVSDHSLLFARLRLA